MAGLDSLDKYISSQKQRITWVKTTTRTTTNSTPFTMIDVAGNPGAGTLTMTGQSGSAAFMPDDTYAGFPLIQFSSGSTYLTRVEFSNTVSARLQLFDLLSKSGSYQYVAKTTQVAVTPDISSRCPDYNTSGSPWGVENEIWVEVNTAFVTGTAWQIQVGYINQVGTSASTVISIAQNAAALTLGKMFQLPLASGDIGVRSIGSVIVTNGGTAMTAGGVNVLIMRPLWTVGRVAIANAGDTHDLLKTGMPIVANSVALYPVIQADSTSTGLPEMTFELANVTV